MATNSQLPEALDISTEVAEDVPSPDLAEHSVRDQEPKGLPYGFVLGLVAGLAVFLISRTQLRDIDLFWHLLAGEELAGGESAHSLGEGWSYAPSPSPWTSTQWLSELLFYAIHASTSWAGLAAFRVLTASLAIAALAWNTLRGRPMALAGFPFLLATTVLAAVSQDRPQQFTLIGAAILGGVLVSGLSHQRLPRWWLLLPATAIWANLHGGWVLVPFVTFLIAVGLMLDGNRSAVVGKALGLTGLSVLAGCVTPSGVGGVTAVFRFTQATSLVAEWEAVQPFSAIGGVSLAMLGVFVIGWSASRGFPRSEALVVLLLFTFTWMAWRNLAPGIALMAPLAARRLTLSFPGVGRPEPSWSVPAGVACFVALTLAGVVNVSTKPNLPSDSQPLELARTIATLPPGQRVLNDYNTSGVVLYFGGNGTQVAIDGRADRYGAKYIDDYVSLMSLQGEWESLLAELLPTSALIKEDTALAYVLQEERGWRQLGRENGWVLLVPRS